MEADGICSSLLFFQAKERSSGAVLREPVWSEEEGEEPKNLRLPPEFSVLEDACLNGKNSCVEKGTDSRIEEIGGSPRLTEELEMRS